MFYEYQGDSCPNVPEGDRSRYRCQHTVQMPASQCQDFGCERPCPVEGCKGKVKRIISCEVNFIIRGEADIPWENGESIRTRIGGQDVRFTFVDHPGTSPEESNRLAGMASKSGITQKGLNKAYMHPKLGRMCVDVASNVPDPLGAIERANSQHGVVQSTPVKRPVKRRPYKYNVAKQLKGTIPLPKGMQ